MTSRKVCGRPGPAVYKSKVQKGSRRLKSKIGEEVLKSKKEEAKRVRPDFQKRDLGRYDLRSNQRKLEDFLVSSEYKRKEFSEKGIFILILFSQTD